MQSNLPYIEELRLSQFRNIESLTLKLSPNPIVFTGLNGAGKTNILEALSFFSPGKGMHGEVYKVLSRQTSDQVFPWAAHLRLNKQGYVNEIGMGLDPESEKDRRIIKIDGSKSVSQKKLTDLINVIWMTPSMDRLLTESLGDRRKFLDRCVYGLDAEHADRLSAYEKKLKERIQLLQNEAPDQQWLAQLENDIVTLGVAIHEARQNYLQVLVPYIKKDTLFPAPICHLTGKFEDFYTQYGRDQAIEFYKAQLKTLRPVDKEVGGSRIGPHRVDLKVIEARNHRSASFSSTGELKGLLIAFVLAHCRLLVYKGKAPIVLLDEVVAHLDPLRREVLCQEILALNLQAWMTGTEKQFFDAFNQKAQYFNMHDGKILEEEKV
jgi:DNA replication and repair protein RecF